MDWKSGATPTKSACAELYLVWIDACDRISQSAIATNKRDFIMAFLIYKIPGLGQLNNRAIAVLNPDYFS